MSTSFDYGAGNSHSSRGDVTGDALSAAITRAVADTLGTDPVELAPLYAAIDPDGLATLFGHRTETPVTVTFQFEGCTVVVSSEGDITVHPPDEGNDAG